MWFKKHFYEPSLRVPLLISGGGFEPMRVDTLVSLVDLLPTFCEVAGASLPEGYTPDGLSQVVALKGRAYPFRLKPLFWKMKGRGPAGKADSFHWVSYVVVSGKWKLLTNEDLSHHELYEISTDPFEKNNLVEAKPEVAEDLVAMLKDWKATLPADPKGNVFSELRKQK